MHFRHAALFHLLVFPSLLLSKILPAYRTLHACRLFMEIRGFEPLTPGLQSRCSSQLSYIPADCGKGNLLEARSCSRAYTSTPALSRGPFSQKGGDPAAPSGTATLLRLHPPYKTYLRRRPPCGWTTGFGHPLLGWCDGRCVQGPGTYSPRRADARLLAIPTSRSRVSDSDPNYGSFSAFRSASRPRPALCLPL